MIKQKKSIFLRIYDTNLTKMALEDITVVV